MKQKLQIYQVGKSFGLKNLPECVVNLLCVRRIHFGFYCKGASLEMSGDAIGETSQFVETSQV